jgi:tripartite-type tricarboxylate transporter receptor subunit TctC
MSPQTSLSKRRLVAGAALSLLGGALVSASARAAGFPDKPLRIVVPFGAGGVADLTARTVAQHMSQTLGQPVVIDNKPGAGGVVASDLVAKAAPDGYTLLLMSNASAVSAGLFKSLPFDTLRDFAPVSVLGTFDIAIVVPANSPFKTLPEMLAFARANPGKLNIGSINIGSSQHLTAELFKSQAAVDVQIVPFNGTPAVVTALRGGQVDAAVEILSPVLPQIQAKALRVLAVTSAQRSPALPDAPTAKESGLPDLLASSWNALAAPAKTPAPVIARLNQAAVAALQNPEVRQKLQTLNVQAQPGTPEQASQLLASEVKRWGDVIVRAKIEKQ